MRHPRTGFRPVGMIRRRSFFWRETLSFSLTRLLARLLRLPDRERFRSPARDAESRRAAWLDLLIVDFGILRLFWRNRARVGGQAWRQNQPTPLDRGFLEREGIRTIVTARHDPRHGGHALIAALAEQEGIDYQSFELFSRAAPGREVLLSAPGFFAQLRYPILMHCKSGADRAGFLAALYRIVVENAPVQEARRELSLRFLHFSGSKTGILDAVFAAYLRETAERPKAFLDWVREDYDPARIEAGFRAGFFADWLDRLILRRE